MFVHAIELEAKKILGSNDDQTLFRTLTQAVQSLMERGHWFHTQAAVDIQTGWDGCTLTLPKEIGVPLAINVDGSPCYFRSRYFQFHLNGGGKFYSVPWAWDDQGQVPVLMDPRAPSELVAIAQLESDAGKFIRVLGKSRGLEVTSQTLDGVTIPGLQIKIRPPYETAGGMPIVSLLPDGIRFDERDAITSQIYSLFSTDASVLDLVTGAVMRLTLTAGLAPAEYVSRNYFIRVSGDQLSVKVYSSRLAALNDVSPIALNLMSSTTEFLLRDTREAVVRTKLEASAPHGISSATTATVSAATYPGGVLGNILYHVAPLDANNLQLFSSKVDAESGVNPIYASSAGASVVLRSRRAAAVVAYLQGSAAHGLVTGDVVFMNNVGGTLPEPLRMGVAYYARVVNSLSISVHLTLRDALSGANPIALTSTGTGTSSFFKLLPCTAILGNLNNISCPAHNLPLTSDTLVRVVSEGTFPTPLDGTTAYFVNPGSNLNTLTIKTNTTTAVNITAVGAGNLFLSLVRTFSVVFGNSWNVDTTGLTTADEMFLSADALLPITSPPVDSVTPVYVRILSVGLVEFYNSAVNAAATPAVTGRFAVTALGAGNTYADKPISVSVEPLDSTLRLSTIGYLNSSVTARLETDGTLPSPLLTGTDYVFTIFNDGVSIKETDNTPVVLTDVGDGVHQLVLDRLVEPRASTSVVIENHTLSTGSEVMFSGDLPAPFTNTDAKFARWLDADQVEFYNTAVNAKNLASTTGRLSYLINDGTPFKAIKISSPTLVDRVTQIDKPVTTGLVTLYAWDPNNADDLTLLGVYGPQDTNPSYRRIRLGKPCAWVRVLYRVTAPKITSREDYIPIEHERAVLTALRAIDLENKNFLAQSAAYWTLAVQYLKDQHESAAGHAAEPPQIQAHGYGNDDEEFLT
jgi:hypothetical protein